MNFHYQEAATAAHLYLSSQEFPFMAEAAEGKNAALLTIAWNRGPSQKVWVDDVLYTLEAGDLILLIANHRFRFEQPEQITSWRFNRDFYCIIDHDEEVGCVGIIFYGMPSPMSLALPPDFQRKLDLLYQVFVDEFATHDNIQGEMLRMLLKRLIILLTRLAKQQHLKAAADNKEVDIIRKFNLLVEKNFPRLHQVQDYADLLHKSPKTLSNLFGKYSDKTPLQLIRERIGLEAKRQLRYTDKSVSEIGFELGFQESAHFSRFFKQTIGLSPGKFRHSSQEGKNW